MEQLQLNFKLSGNKPHGSLVLNIFLIPGQYLSLCSCRGSILIEIKLFWHRCTVLCRTVVNQYLFICLLHSNYKWYVWVKISTIFFCVWIVWINEYNSQQQGWVVCIPWCCESQLRKLKDWVSSVMVGTEIFWRLIHDHISMDGQAELSIWSTFKHGSPGVGRQL